jgi:hypothetical protein
MNGNSLTELNTQDLFPLSLKVPSPSVLNSTVLTINVPVVYCLYEAGRNDFDAGNIHFKGHGKGWALKISRVPFGHKES